MAPMDVDASNPCVPPSHPLSCSIPPVPSTIRGEPLSVFDGKAGRINADRPALLYSNGRLVVVRELDGDLFDDDVSGNGGKGGKAKWKGGMERPAGVKAFVYRGHTAQVTAAKFSPSGCYVASADIRGHLRVWSYDNPEHLCKLELSTAMAGPIRDISWDYESKRLCVVGEGSKTDASAACARVIQWDTGVTCGELGQHTRNRASSCSFKPNRPMRIVTGGGDDSRVLFNKGPPFVRVVEGTASENCHERGSVNAVRYSPDGSKIVSVGTDRSVVFYDGKTCASTGRMADVHSSSIYGCDWSSDSQFVATCSADGTVKLIDATTRTVAHTWNVLDELRKRTLGKDARPSPLAASASASSSSDLVSPSRGMQHHQASGSFSSGLGLGSSDRGGRGAGAASKQFKPDVGGMVLGCAFVGAGDVPVGVCLNGEIAILPMPAGIMPSAGKNGGADVKFLTGHRAPVAAMALDSSSMTAYTGDTDGIICSWRLGVAGGGGPACRSLGRLGRSPPKGKGNGDNDDDCEPPDDSLMNRVQAGSIAAMTCVNNGVLSVGWDDALRIKGHDDLGFTKKVDLGAQPNAVGRGTSLACVVTVRGLLLVKDGALVSPLIELPYPALSVDVSSDDSVVIVGGEDCSIHIYSVDSSSGPGHWTLTERRSVSSAHHKPVHAVRLSPAGKCLATSDVRDVCVWDISTSADGNYDCAPVIGKGRWCFHTQRVRCLSWSPDGTVLASGGMDDSIYLWSVKKKTKRVHYPFAHRGGIAGLEFVDDGGAGNGMVLLSAGSDGCVNLWDVTDDVARKFG